MPHSTESGGHRLAAVAVAVVVLALSGVSATIAYRFAQLVGTTDIDRAVFAAIGVLAVCLKALTPFVLFAAWRQRRPVVMGVCAIILLLCCSYSLSATYGYGAAHRSLATSERETRADLQERLRGLPSHRPAAVLEPLVKVERDRTKRAALEAELGAARTAQQLRMQLERVPVALSAEPQIRQLARLAGWSTEATQSALLVILALLVELGEMMGLYASSLLWRRPEPERESVQHEKTVHVEAAKPEPAQRAKHERPLEAWIRGYLASSDGAVTVPEAYAAYAAEWRARRRRASSKPTFARMFDRIARQAGIDRRLVGGRLQYSIAA